MLSSLVDPMGSTAAVPSEPNTALILAVKVVSVSVAPTVMAVWGPPGEVRI